jgi:hypothetical protein
MIPLLKMISPSIIGLILLQGPYMPPQTIIDGALFYDPSSGGVSQGIYDPYVGQGSSPVTTPNSNGQVQGASTQGTVAPSTVAPSTAGAGNAGAAAYYQQLNDQLNFQKSLLPQQAATGHANVLDAYNSAYKGLQNQQDSTNLDSGIQRNQTVNENVLARNQVGDNVYQQNTGIQRLLGSHGAGDSSAADILAPYAAAEQGNQQLTGIQRDYGNNLSALDLADRRRKEGFDAAFGGLNTDRQNQDSQIDSGLASTQQGLDQSIARYRAHAGQPIDPAASAEVNALSQKITDLGRKATFTPQAVNTTAPNLAQYTADRYAAPGATQTAVDPSLQGATGAFSNLLGLDKNKQKIGA